MALEKYGVTAAVMPACQWSYEQPLPQGGAQRIPPRGCAGTDQALVSMVSLFRAQNHIEQGDPAFDISEHIKRLSPQNDRFKGRRVFVPDTTPQKYRPLIERIREWIHLTAPKQPRLLIEDEAKERVEICAHCQQNVEWAGGCSPCNDDARSRGKHLRQRASYPPADALKGCRLHGMLLPAAVFLDRDALPALHEKAPAECWMRK